MIYSRGIVPESMSKLEYENSNRNHWHDLNKDKPSEGQCVVILHTNGNLDPDAWYTDIAYYCDGSFYCLELDPHLGVLRKEHINEKIRYWSTYIHYDVAEVKELMA